MKYTQAFFNRILDSIDVRWLVEEHFELEDVGLRGENLWCRCPFHEEKDRSFSIGVSGEYKGVWHCFGSTQCGSGNLFHFVMKLEKLPFKNSVEYLAKLAGVSNNYTDIGALENAFKKLSRTIQIASEKEIERVGLSPMYPDFVLNYLVNGRKIPYEYAYKIMVKYQIGTSMYVDMYGKKYMSIGMHIFKDGKRADTFREIVYPSLNRNKRYCRNGRVKNVLFGIEDIKVRHCVLVEGLWDMFRCRQYGFPAVTSFNNNLSVKQAEQILENFDVVYVAFDNDDGGEEGRESVVNTLNTLVQLRIVCLPSHRKDPDEATEKEFTSAIRESE